MQQVPLTAGGSAAILPGMTQSAKIGGAALLALALGLPGVVARAAGLGKSSSPAALTRLAPSREAGLRSLPGKPVRVTFANLSSRPVRLYWLDYQGRRKPYGSLAAGKKLRLKSYSRHAFVVADERGRALAVFVVGTKPATAAVTDADVDAAPAPGP